MAGIGEDTYSLLEDKIASHKETLYTNPSCFVELYLKNVLLAIRTAAFDKISRQDLFSYYIDRDCLIPIGELFTYQT